MNAASRLLVRGIDVVNRRGKSVGVRLVRYTGKSPHFIHPKHLVESPWHDWYLDHVKPADLVLDVGCGNGAHTGRVGRACRVAVGCDYDPRNLAVGRARAGGRAEFIACDVTRPLPFADRTFDAVLFLDVIEHVVPRVAVLGEIRRVLREDGRLLVSAPNRDTSWRRTLRDARLFAYSDPDHKIEYTESEFLAELAEGGFAPIGSTLPVVYDTPWAGMIDAAGGVSLRLYARLSAWKRAVALAHPGESTGFCVVAKKRA